MNTDLSNLKEMKLVNLKEKYKRKETLIIARKTRQTIRFIEKNCHNFPNEYRVLKDRIISGCYDILEYIYRANIFQDIEDIIINHLIAEYILVKVFDSKFTESMIATRKNNLGF